MERRRREGRLKGKGEVRRDRGIRRRLKDKIEGGGEGSLGKRAGREKELRKRGRARKEEGRRGREKA